MIIRAGVAAVLAAMLGAATLGAASARAQAPVLTVAGVGDCEKITKDGDVPPSPHFWDPVGRRLLLDGGRNEMVGAQLLLTATGGDVPNVNVKIGDLAGPGVIPVNPNLELSLELYQFVTDGSYSWGPPSKVLPSQKWYPEVLAPFNDPYSPQHEPVGAPFDIRTKDGKNQGVWIDLYIPKTARPGLYKAPIQVTVGSRPVFTGSLELTVHPFTIPDETHVDGFGELYGMAYDFQNAGYGKGFDRWWTVASRYHQMAHQHRFVISERAGAGPTLANLDDWARAYSGVLDGSLFTPAHGYHGPGEGTGVAFFKAPFSQDYNGETPDWTAAQLKSYADNARKFWDLVTAKGWDHRRWCAYIVDEARTDARGVANFQRLQQALDAGSNGHLALIWTSHTDPATLSADPATDLRGIVRWWAPNGHACDPVFLDKRSALGETTWFYHSGHPAIGVHAVNATGIDLRTWGVICWRYRIGGSFWWAMDLGDADHPLARPTYKPEDTRWGNGVLFYPGSRLSDVGLPNIDGPLSSLRMKAYRRGLQDYEYGWLLQQQGKGGVADELVRKVVPLALTDATGTTVGGVTAGPRTAGNGPYWSQDVNDWYAMREALAAELDKGAQGGAAANIVTSEDLTTKSTQLRSKRHKRI